MPLQVPYRFHDNRAATRGSGAARRVDLPIAVGCAAVISVDGGRGGCGQDRAQRAAS